MADDTKDSHETHDANGVLRRSVLNAYEEHQVDLGEVVMNHTFEYMSLPDAAQAMHQADPERFVGVLRSWAMKLPA